MLTYQIGFIYRLDNIILYCFSEYWLKFILFDITILYDVLKLQSQECKDIYAHAHSVHIGMQWYTSVKTCANVI